MRLLKGPLTVCFLGFLSVLIVLEIGLRATGYFHALKRQPAEVRHIPQGAFTIVCLGDSLVEGVGAGPGKSFPAQLEVLFKQQMPEKRVTVINQGRVTENTSQLLQKLPGILESMKPDLVIVLSGGANYWNYIGCDLSRSSRWKDFYEFLYRFRIFKLSKLLFLQIREKALKKGGGLSSIPARDILSDKSNSRSDIPDVKGQNPFSDGRSLNDISPQSGSANAEKPTVSSAYFSEGSLFLRRGEYDKAIHWFTEALKRDPGDYLSYEAIAFAYLEMNERQKAIPYFKKSILSGNPDFFIFTNLRVCYKDSGREKEEAAFYRQFVGRFPQLRDYIVLLEREERQSTLDRWIEKDYRAIIERCKARNVPVLFLDYPRIVERTTDILRKVTHAYTVPFVCLSSFFYESRLRHPQVNYFASDNAHCNADGYLVIAQQLYQRICKEFGL